MALHDHAGGGCFLTDARGDQEGELPLVAPTPGIVVLFCVL
jgi:hypothetical protein